jgi:hypothetical protein
MKMKLRAPASRSVRILALSSLLLPGALALLLAGAGCEGLIQPAPGETELGQVKLSLAAVPTDILCLRVVAAGTERTATRDIDITAGQPVAVTLAGIPLGPVEFTAQAFGKACGEVTATTVADWVSDPTTVSVSLSHLASVELTMHRNGRAKVSIDFPDEPICSPPGASCASGSTCCSRACSKGLCKPSVDGGNDADDDSI